MAKEMTANEIRAELDEAYRRWNEISKHGCSDPSWPDGVNMNLVRNHIVYFQKMLMERENRETQLSLFGEPVIEGERDLPPRVPEGYMAKGGAYFDDRCQKLERFGFSLVFDLKGDAV